MRPSGIERNVKSLATIDLIIPLSYPSTRYAKRAFRFIHLRSEASRKSFFPFFRKDRAWELIIRGERASVWRGRERILSKPSRLFRIIVSKPREFHKSSTDKSADRPRLVRTCTPLCPVPSTFSRPNSRVPGRQNFPPSRQANSAEGNERIESRGRETQLLPFLSRIFRVEPENNDEKKEGKKGAGKFRPRWL